MKMLIPCAAALLLSACASKPTTAPQPTVVTKEVLVPVNKSCVPPKLGGPPDYVDSKAALRKAAGPEDRFQLVIAGREQRIARLGELEPVVTACRK